MIFVPTQSRASSANDRREARPTFHPDELTKLSILAFTRAFVFSYFEIPGPYYIEIQRVREEDSKKVGKVT